MPLLVASLFATAQRFVDLEVTILKPSTGDTAYSNETFKISSFFKNNGPDSLKMTDSIAFQISLNGGIISFNTASGMVPYLILTYQNINPGDISGASFTFGVNSGLDTGMADICVKFFSVGIDDSLMDADTTDNILCSNILVSPGVYVNDLSKFASVMVYPNPATEQVTFNIDMQQAGELSIHITDLAGRVVASRVLATTNTGQQQVKMDVSTLAPGMYLYNISDGVHATNGKIQVQ